RVCSIGTHPGYRVASQNGNWLNWKLDIHLAQQFQSFDPPYCVCLTQYGTQSQAGICNALAGIARDKPVDNSSQSLLLSRPSYGLMLFCEAKVNFVESLRGLATMLNVSRGINERFQNLARLRSIKARKRFNGNFGALANQR
ncbi:MAG: hypothetical protein NTW74_21115, partial [Acidobacteria bacterium]|nr:hypothetical protein [Acidobacteriota bacterium]